MHIYTYDITSLLSRIIFIITPNFFHISSPPLMTCLNLTSSHDSMLNPVYIPPSALEEVDVEKTKEDDDEITGDNEEKGALGADPGGAS